jgi:hypothetical protein
MTMAQSMHAAHSTELVLAQAQVADWAAWPPCRGPCLQQLLAQHRCGSNSQCTPAVDSCQSRQPRVET